MDIEGNIEEIKAGLHGEQIVRDYLKTIPNCEFAQLDLIAKIDDYWYSFEIKHQDMFEAPPFDGHGLPIWQVDMRMKLFRETGIIPLFFVLDKQRKVLIYNSLINLERGNKFVTGRKSRVIYPIENFKFIKRF